MLTIQNFKKYILPVILVSFVFSQDADTTTTENEENARESYISVDVSFSQDKGNTDFLSAYYGFNYTLLGDLGPLKDTEFLLDYNRSDDQFDGEPFTDDQSLTLKFDIWANQRFSPFLFFQKSFDNIIGLEDRMNYGLGAKLGLPFGLSVSYAFLFEKEDYLYYDYIDSTGSGEYYYTDSTMIDTNYYYYDAYYGDEFYVYTDSTEWFIMTDSVETKPEEFFRHSIRPKIKLKLFNDNLVFDYRFYYKPKVDDFEDYLLEHELKVSLATFYEALTIDFTYTNKYNSRYDGTNILNRETGAFYKPVDENMYVGLSFMF